MTEEFLHFVWKYQYFNHKNLLASNGYSLSITKTGIHNHDSGPDFSQASLIMEGVKWSGDIELHINSSDWYQHKHQEDYNYEKVVLHVVWNHDKDVFYHNKTKIPTLELKDIVNHKLIDRYKAILSSLYPIPCQNLIALVPNKTIKTTFREALQNRLEIRSKAVFKLLEKNQHDWRQTSFELICKSFGFKTNKTAFEELGKSINYSIIRKHKNDIQQIEALLFGQAGFLGTESKSDEYKDKLKLEYKFLSKKYKLNPIPSGLWKLSKLRPSNFPTIRIAQLATWLTKHEDIFSSLIEIKSKKAVFDFFQSDVSNYWITHYNFNKEGKPKSKKLGKTSIETIYINAVIPLQYSYGVYKNDKKVESNIEKSLTELSPEKNSILNEWNSIGVEFKSANETQGAIEQFNNMCNHKKCLHCSIGKNILGKHD